MHSGLLVILPLAVTHHEVLFSLSLSFSLPRRGSRKRHIFAAGSAQDAVLWVVGIQVNTDLGVLPG